MRRGPDGEHMELRVQNQPGAPLGDAHLISGVSPQSPEDPRKHEKLRPPDRGSRKFAGVKICDFHTGQKSARKTSNMHFRRDLSTDSESTRGGE